MQRDSSAEFHGDNVAKVCEDPPETSSYSETQKCTEMYVRSDRPISCSKKFDNKIVECIACPERKNCHVAQTAGRSLHSP